MKRPWVFPAIIFIFLLLALLFRWDYTATKSEKFYVIKWKTDRWTGQKWEESYSPGSTEINRLDEGFLDVSNGTALTIWVLSLTTSGLWFIKTYKRKPPSL